VGEHFSPAQLVAAKGSSSYFPFASYNSHKDARWEIFAEFRTACKSTGSRPPAILPPLYGPRCKGWRPKTAALAAGIALDVLTFHLISTFFLTAPLDHSGGGTPTHRGGVRGESHGTHLMVAPKEGKRKGKVMSDQPIQG